MGKTDALRIVQFALRKMDKKGSKFLKYQINSELHFLHLFFSASYERAKEMTQSSLMIHPKEQLLLLACFFGGVFWVFVLYVVLRGFFWVGFFF